LVGCSSILMFSSVKILSLLSFSKFPLTVT
jgi:hypothetical protein